MVDFSEIFEEEDSIELSERDQLKLAEMLLSQPKINAAMAATIQRQLEQMGVS